MYVIKQNLLYAYQIFSKPWKPLCLLMIEALRKQRTPSFGRTTPSFGRTKTRRTPSFGRTTPSYKKQTLISFFFTILAT